MMTLFKESVISIESVLNQIVVKTLVGSANTAAALIDKLSIPSVIGTLAGDDTILLILNSVDAVDGVVAQLNAICE
jgi:transcriptional regulator of arginine metabolism